jgi:glycosyltransferase involved in cell wall biosynthesis
MRISLAITTYNWKEALEIVLLSAFGQRLLPDEILIADDGSSDGTADVIDRLRQVAPVPLMLCWQEDKGFRAARSRNLAISASTGDYLIFIDGDMVLHPAFIADHKEAAIKNCFVQGSRVILSALKTKEVLAAKRVAVSFFSSGIENRKNSLRLPLGNAFFSPLSRNLTGIRTCNFAFWKKDAEAVNGFNEDFVGWGREDSEFAARLLNNGIIRKNLRFAATAYHLFHPPQTRQTLPSNDFLLQTTIDKKLTWCANGLDSHLEK